MSSENVKLAERRLVNICKVLCIDIRDLTIKELGEGSNMVFVSFVTNKGSYGIPIKIVENLKEQFPLHNMFTSEAIYVSTFTNDCLFSIVGNMLEQKDTMPLEIFLTTLTLFWDVFSYYPGVEPKILYHAALSRIYNYIYKNPKAGTDNKSYIKHPKEFINFITGPIGNRIYFWCGFNSREEMKAARRRG